MLSLAARLDTALRAAGLAITGVSIGVDEDRSTWKVMPRELQAAAQPVIDAFLLPTPAQLLDEDALREVDAKVLKAIVMELYAIVPAPKPTLVQLRANILARYKAL